MFVGVAKLWLGADAEAVGWLRRGLEANRNFPSRISISLLRLALLGHVDEARAAVQAGLALDPNFTIRRYRAALRATIRPILPDASAFYQGMRMAGVPEG